MIQSTSRWFGLLLALFVVGALLASACSSPTATPTPAPPTATPMPSSTPVPPTATATAAPTPTSTGTPTPTPVFTPTPPPPSPTPTPTATPAPVAQTGNAVFAVTDAAANMSAATSIKITVGSLKVHSPDAGWITVNITPQTFDLLALKAQNISQLLAQIDLNVDSYDQAELDVSKATVTDANGTSDAKLPSGKLQIKGQINVKANSTTAMELDFVADQSLHLTGNGVYILAPVIMVKTTSDASVDIKGNNVNVSAGKVDTDLEEGMDVLGNTDVGLRITPDAKLSIDASGKIVQTAGQELATGTLKSVDAASGSITITTKDGSNIVLSVGANSKIMVRGAPATLADLSKDIGLPVAVEFNSQSNALTEIDAAADDSAKAEIGSMITTRATIQSVDVVNGTITVLATSGATLTLKVAAATQIRLGGVIITLASLVSKIGSPIVITYDASTDTASDIEGQTQPDLTVTGVLKAVNLATSTITVTPTGGADITLKIGAFTEVQVNGQHTTLLSLTQQVGVQGRVEYNVQTLMADSIEIGASSSTAGS